MPRRHTRKSSTLTFLCNFGAHSKSSKCHRKNFRGIKTPSGLVEHLLFPINIDIRLLLRRDDSHVIPSPLKRKIPIPFELLSTTLSCPKWTYSLTEMTHYNMTRNRFNVPKNRLQKWLEPCHG